MKRVFRALLLSLFVYGQIGSTAHAHEHAEETQHDACAFSILTSNEDGEVSDVFDLPDLSDGPDYLSANIGPYFRQIEANLAGYCPFYKSPARHGFHGYLDCARAPPLQ